MSKRRRIIWTAVCIAIGLVSNVGLAWWCAITSPTIGVQLKEYPARPSEYLVQWGPPPGWGWNEERGFGVRGQYATFYITLRERDPLPTRESIAEPGAPLWMVIPNGEIWGLREQRDNCFVQALQDPFFQEDGHPVPQFQTEVKYRAMCAGWPLQCLAATQIYENQPDASPPEIAGGVWWEAPWPVPIYDCVLPLHPVWPNFLADTALFALCWSALLIGPGAIRRSFRTRRGLCPRCAYDLKHDLAAGCPECGWGRGEEKQQSSK